MQHEPKPGDAGFEFTTKDTILLMLCGFSGLLGFALSFTLMQPDGRPYLFCCCVAIFVLSLLFAERKKEIALGTLAFILLRLVWAAIVTALHAGHP